MNSLFSGSFPPNIGVPLKVQAPLVGSKSEKRMDLVPLTTEDLLLFAGSVAAVTYCALEYSGYSSELLSTTCRVATCVLALGECYLRVQDALAEVGEQNREEILQNRVSELEKQDPRAIVLGTIVLVGLKWATYAISASWPVKYPTLYKIGAIAMLPNSLGNIGRAFQELKKTFELNFRESYWEMARNTVVHGLNASCDVFAIGYLLRHRFWLPEKAFEHFDIRLRFNWRHTLKRALY